jgi:hypothetical protein
MGFPRTGLTGQDAFDRKLVGLLRPDGRACPARRAADRLRVHRRHRAPVLDDVCRGRGRAFNTFTGTEPDGTYRRDGENVLIPRGFAQGVPTASLARGLACNRKQRLGLRRRLQGNATRWPDRNSPGDRVV